VSSSNLNCCNVVVLLSRTSDLEQTPVPGSRTSDLEQYQSLNKMLKSLVSPLSKQSESGQCCGCDLASALYGEHSYWLQQANHRHKESKQANGKGTIDLATCAICANGITSKFEMAYLS